MGKISGNLICENRSDVKKRFIKLKLLNKLTLQVCNWTPFKLTPTLTNVLLLNMTKQEAIEFTS